MPRCFGYNFDHLAMFWCVFVSKHITNVWAFFSTGSSVENTAVSDVNRNVVFEELLRNFVRS
jgi:hypothetical protein